MTNIQSSGSAVAVKSCKVCGGKGYYFDSDGHGGCSWKRPCTYCSKTRS
jgi:DnaJ-class molecular chaperone